MELRKATLIASSTSASYENITIDKSVYKQLYLCIKITTNVMSPILIPMELIESMPNIGFVTQYHLSSGDAVTASIKYVSDNTFAINSSRGVSGYQGAVYGIK